MSAGHLSNANGRKTVRTGQDGVETNKNNTKRAEEEQLPKKKLIIDDDVNIVTYLEDELIQIVRVQSVKIPLAGTVSSEGISCL